ncbi:MAG: hypothetical protein MI919_20415, partial [Holophagales bacterium]|nr:hypothetical protein [Holophagales bacterium]
HGAPRAEEGTAQRRAPREGEAGVVRVERWCLGSGAGREYARVSGDYNPIHLWPWTARLLGQPCAIAHGIYLAARCVAALEGRYGAPCKRLDVSFKTPVRLPGECALYAFELDEAPTQAQARPSRGNEPPARRFELWSGDGERPHVFGRFSPGE